MSPTPSSANVNEASRPQSSTPNADARSPSISTLASMSQLSLSSTNASGAPSASGPATPNALDSVTRTSEDNKFGHTRTSSSTMSAQTPPVLTPRDSFVTQALGQSLGRSNSNSKSRSHCPCGHHRSESHHRSELGPKFHVESALGTGKGISRFVGAGLKSPMDFTMALARGFHNAPKLYGDKTVRPTEKISDLQSGLKAAGKVMPLANLPLLD